MAESATAGATNTASGGNQPPVITTQPQSQTVLAGTNVSFSATASGNPTPVYQWQHEATNLPGAVGTTLTLTNVQPVHAGTYKVYVTNSAGSIYSQPATLTILVPPNITDQPFSQSVMQGSNVTLTVAATGTAPLSYQWYFNYSALIPATNTVLVISNIDQSQAGTYQVVITNIAGQAVSQAASLTVQGLDSDGDGLPDAWMLANFGHPTGMIGDCSRAQDDADGDGMNNLQEYLSGTNPLDSNSLLKLSAFATGAGTSQIQFTAVAGYSYTVQFTTNLAAGNWMKYLDFAASPTTQLVGFNLLTTNAPGQFLRIITPLQP
jgi:hypothetical protein